MLCRKCGHHRDEHSYVGYCRHVNKNREECKCFSYETEPIPATAEEK